MKSRTCYVIKVGTKVISLDGIGVSRSLIVDIARQISELMDSGIEVVLVSSGAVAAGRAALTLPKVRRRVCRWPAIAREQTSHKQLLAGIGQAEMIQAWKIAFGNWGYGVAQVLVTNQEFCNEGYARELALNIEQLLRMGVVPIVNENDLLTKTELENNFSDNDELMLLMAKLTGAETIICLMDCDGYYEDGKLLKELTRLERPRSQCSSLTRGGISGKLLRCSQAMENGIDVFLANGRTSGVLKRIIFENHNPGTFGRGKR